MVVAKVGVLGRAAQMETNLVAGKMRVVIVELVGVEVGTAVLDFVLGNKFRLYIASKHILASSNTGIHWAYYLTMYTQDQLVEVSCPDPRLLFHMF